MVCRLIQKKNIGISINQLAETDLGLLSAAQYPHLTLNMLRGKATFCKCRTNFILCVGREFLPQFLDTGSLVVSLDLLLKISELEIFSSLTVSLE